MKHIFSVIILCLFVTGLFAQIDRSTPPVAGPAPKINIGEYKKFKLPNGLQVFVVENNKLPMVAYSLTLELDPILEGEAAGYVELAGSLMRSGTKNLTKAQIDEKVDFIGATLNTTAQGMYARSLKKHSATLLELMSDVLLNPTFPEEELEKSLKQMKTGIQAAKDEPEAIADNVSKVLNYGANDPYGELITEKTLDNINVTKLLGYHQTYYRPNIAYLVIVGDITLKEAKTQAKKYFGNWKQAPVPKNYFELPKTYDQPKVAISNKDGANQSTIMVTHTVNLTPGHPDAIKASVMNTVLGGGSFNARLFQNLREKKAFTYGAYSGLNPDKRIGSFSASSQVRTSVTDSALTEILYEMKRMRTEPVPSEDLDLVKNMMNGSFSRSLEDPQTIARFALNIERYKLPADYYTTYLEKLAAVTAADVQEMANKYLRPDNAVILAVGDVMQIENTMKAFSPTGEVTEYDFYGNVVEKTGIPTGVSAESIIENYIQELGGETALLAIKDIKSKGTMAIQGMSLDINTIQKAPNKVHLEIVMGGNVITRQVFDGVNGKVISPMGEQQLEGVMLEEMKETATLFPELGFKTDGTKIELLGMEELDGLQMYKLQIIRPSGKTSTTFFSVKDGLKYREISPSPQGTISSTFLKYQVYNGVKIPTSMKQNMGPQSFDVEFSTIEVNTGVEDIEFAN
jgi:predicted Zn-dependent peptidase